MRSPPSPADPPPAVHAPGLGRTLLAELWILAFALAAAWLLRPAPAAPLPAGWQRWESLGALFALLPDGDAVIAGGSAGLFRVTPEAATTLSATGLEGSVVHALARDPRGRLWVGHERGLGIRDRHGWHHYGPADGLPRPPIRVLLTAGNDAWIGGEDALVRVSGTPPWDTAEKRTVLAPTAALPAQRVSALLRDAAGGLWLGTNSAPAGGVYRLQDGKVRFWGTQEGLPHPQVSALLQDRRGRIWAGTGFLDRGGAALFAPADGRWRLAATLQRPALAGPKVRSLAEDADGHYWVGSENDGLAIRSETGLLRVLRRPDGLPGPEVTAIVQTADGAVWLATLTGLARIAPEAVRQLTGTSTGGAG